MHEPGLGDGLALADRTGDAEVGDLHLAVDGDEDVAGLHVAVHDAVTMGVTEGLCDVGGDRGRPRRRQRRLGADDRRQRLAVDELHDDVIGAVRLPPVKDRDDVRVRQVGGCLGLPAEPLDERVVRGELREEHLQGDRAVQQQVVGQVDLGRTASGDLAVELVTAVVHRGRSVGHRRGKPIPHAGPAGEPLRGEVPLIAAAPEPCARQQRRPVRLPGRLSRRCRSHPAESGRWPRPRQSESGRDRPGRLR